MEPRKSEKPVESGGLGQPASSPPEKRKRRFQVIKLEERIAPAGAKRITNAACWTHATHKGC
jgi:hypothetical protein